MPIDWNLVGQIGVPFLTLFVGVFINKRVEDRPRLITYKSQSFAIRSKTPDGRDLNVHTHTIVVRNAGRKSASNVRIGHAILPSFQVYPSIRHEVQDLPDGTKEIVIPTLVPREQVIVNYLYFPPLLWSQINTYTKSDDGFAKVVNMTLSPQYPKWLNWLSATLTLVGLTTVSYLLVQLVRFLIRLATTVPP